MDKPSAIILMDDVVWCPWAFCSTTFDAGSSISMILASEMCSASLSEMRGALCLMTLGVTRRLEIGASSSSSLSSTGVI